ncbi:thrombospondin type 3 repeat-containing protein [Flavivirga algicola]|uniref:T9SS type A sorting domain-containing protein n=1 Tax=Flavivirga algicola TaxID=2729136 RepID=A0ABX1S005_9FLAO|nr:thrombospondin type 3 repeat-containing protein [Flavivirga algicola]NMH89171.1 T9SS type A sorting domain-containing protein [Flavivirga algicola]
MKKKSLMLFCLLCLSFIIDAQNYHRLETYPTNNPAAACTETGNQKYRVKVNINIDYLLDLNKFYRIDLGTNFNLGVRYCKVLNRGIGPGDADFDLESTDIKSEVDVCEFNFYRYHRFETFTTLEKAKNNICGQTTAHDGRSKANIKITQLLDVGKVYLINLGNGLGTRYCKILNRYNGRGDADFDIDDIDYQTVFPPITFNCSEPDTDGDGVPDSQDNCPNEAGPSSNNGCPLPTGKPNLYMSSLKILRQSNNQVIFNYPNGSTNTPTLNNNNWYDIIVGVKNDGQTTAQSVSLDVIFTNNTSREYPHPSVPFYGVETDANIGNIGTNQVIEKTFSIFVGNNIGVSPNLSNNSIYRLFFDIDINDDIDETNESDNIKFTQFKYSSSTNKNHSKLNQPQPSFENVLKPYPIDIYNFQGRKVLSKEVSSKEEEGKLIQSLTSGLYVIKSKDKTYKVSIK